MHFAQAALYGLRFDTFSILVCNSLFILLHAIPSNLFHKAWYQSILKWLFIITNSVFIMANCIDIGYFRFIKKRSSADLLEQVGGQTDMGKLLPQYLKDFWWILLIYILLVWLLIRLYKKVKPVVVQEYVFTTIKQWSLIFLSFVLFSGCVIVGLRGGVQRLPIDIVNAGSVAIPEEIPIVLNTPFTLIKSAGQSTLPNYNFYDEAFMQANFKPVHHFKDSVFKKQNVVVLLLESFAKEYTKLGTSKNTTPFLDSLMDHSLIFTNAFSNGTKSIEGIPAVLSGLPSLMENPFVNSVYANNKQTSFANILSKEGYTTAFFHGGINGTMNFDDWAPSAGYNDYFGRNEYNDDKDFDGFWGIWDEPFLQYTIKKMNGFKEPFHSAIFTLSSHHPYYVPEKYKGKFAKGPLENAESVRYADYSLKLFFDAAKKEAWYNNTLFILCADHGSISDHPFYKRVTGNQCIPVLFFKGDHSLKGTYEHAFSQMDILPSALNVMGYNKPFYSLGRSYVDNLNGKSYFYANSTYYVYTDSMMYSFSDAELKSVINYKRDSIAEKELIGRNKAMDEKASADFKVFIQGYNQMFINNSGSVK